MSIFIRIIRFKSVQSVVTLFQYIITLRLGKAFFLAKKGMEWGLRVEKNKGYIKPQGPAFAGPWGVILFILYFSLTLALVAYLQLTSPL